ncbi:TetR/AcrR family transcriptional regulator [Parabacteroides sp. FAFU027]|uniref:TetR/AcrR family transcriptional regulator n=1 Tax=Parabacteroides sp. FAFU027 TaxID=2922715 RepID=UPI001FAF788B|nr:TetR/AcrR family transcriptional regulator [Parabacteroides sp. FAFU027]
MKEEQDNMHESTESSDKKRLRRSKKLINNEIMKAVSYIIGEQGFSRLGINTVSEQAQVEKPYIYRNFGTFEKVLEEYILKNDFWLRFIIQRSFQKNEEGYFDIHTTFTNLMVDLYKTMDDNRDFRNMILWELYENTPFIRSNAERREIESGEQMILLHDHFKDVNIDIEAITALFISGIYYLVLHKNVSTFCGIDYKTLEGKKRMITALKNLSDMLFEQAEQKKTIIKRMLAKGIDHQIIAEVVEVDKNYVMRFVEK